MDYIILSSLSILAGILFCWYNIKKNEDSKSVFERGNNLQGFMVGLLFIALGIIGFLNYYKVW